MNITKSWERSSYDIEIMERESVTVRVKDKNGQEKDVVTYSSPGSLGLYWYQPDTPITLDKLEKGELALIQRVLDLLDKRLTLLEEKLKDVRQASPSQ